MDDPTPYTQGRTLLDLSREAAKAERDAAAQLLVDLRLAVAALPPLTQDLGSYDPFARPKAALALVDQLLAPGLERLEQARVAAKAARDAVYKV